MKTRRTGYCHIPGGDGSWVLQDTQEPCIDGLNCSLLFSHSQITTIYSQLLPELAAAEPSFGCTCAVISPALDGAIVLRFILVLGPAEFLLCACCKVPI
jgi:hypothetical protein